MKKIISALLCSIALLSACKKEDNTLASQLTGSWELSSLDGSAVREGMSVWLDFYPDGTFCIYQRADSDSQYRKLSGSWSVTGTTFKGTYDDGSALASDYEISIDGEHLKMTSIPTGEETRYKRASLPESVTENVSNKS